MKIPRFSDSTLKSFTKEMLIEEIRILEHNYLCEKETSERQYELLKKLTTKTTKEELQ